MPSMTDLLPLSQAPEEVSDADLLLTHQPDGGGLVAKPVSRGVFLTGIPRTGSAAQFESVEAAAGITGATATLSGEVSVGSLKCGASITRIILSAQVEQAVTIAAGASQSISLSAADSLVGDFVLPRVTNLTAGVIASAVAGAGAISVTIANLTGTEFSATITARAMGLRLG